MKRALIASLLIFLLFPVSILAHPLDVPLNGEYSINVQTVNLGADEWRFIYTITNVLEGIGDYTGLDGFYVMVPLTATISNIQVPPRYQNSGVGYWLWSYNSSWPPVDSSTYKWLKFWGADPSSVYPIEKSAVFSFDASNVQIGTNQGYVITYLDEGVLYTDPPYTGATTDWWYHSYYSQLTGPVPNIPEPATMLLLGLGLMGLAGVRRKIRK